MIVPVLVFMATLGFAGGQLVLNSISLVGSAKGAAAAVAQDAYNGVPAANWQTDAQKAAAAELGYPSATCDGSATAPFHCLVTFNSAWVTPVSGCSTCGNIYPIVISEVIKPPLPGVSSSGITISTKAVASGP